jgi:hypothetical protein
LRQRLPAFSASPEAQVANSEDYLYSPARDYAGENGLIDIEFA